MTAHRIDSNPIHLGLGASAVVEPEFGGGMAWYEAYGDRHDAADGAEGRLVTRHTFTAPWDSWEMHPEGDEVVLCLEGEMVLHQDFPNGTTASVRLAAGEYVINLRGVWHTADVHGSATALFITAGLGTQHRPR
ncbi:cupin domain-containing protein [bacterium]|nr:cupin domain-containing protein [bacterium]